MQPLRRGEDPAHPGLPDCHGIGHPAPALPHFWPHRLPPAGHHGHQLRLRPHPPGYRNGFRHRRNPGRRAHRRLCGNPLRYFRQAHPQALPPAGHRHGHLYHRPFPLPHRRAVYGRRQCLQRVVRRRPELDCGPHHLRGGHYPPELHQGRVEAGRPALRHDCGLHRGLYRGNRGPLRRGRRRMVRPAQVHALRNSV